MITRKTAERLWVAYREIESAEKLLSDMEEVREREHMSQKDRQHERTLKDAFGREQHLQLGIPSGKNSHRIFEVSPRMADAVIRAHIAGQKAKMLELQEVARVELDTPDIDKGLETDNH